jgi:hypothetical protein
MRRSIPIEIIEKCACIAESYASRNALSTHAVARDIASDIRALANDIRRMRDESTDFPPQAFV